MTRQNAIDMRSMKERNIRIRDEDYNQQICLYLPLRLTNDPEAMARAIKLGEIVKPAYIHVSQLASIKSLAWLLVPLQTNNTNAVFP